MCTRITRKLRGYTPFQQLSLNNIVFRTIVIFLQHYTIRDTLKELFTEQGFWFGLWHWLHVAARSDAFELRATGELLGDVVTATSFHIVDEDDADSVLLGEGLKGHQSSRNHLFPIVVSNIRGSIMLGKSVNNYQF